jgi:hypothetical protein
MRRAGKSAFSFSPGFNRVVALFALIVLNCFNGFLAATTKTVETVLRMRRVFGPVPRLKPGVNEQPDCVQLSSNASIVALLGREDISAARECGRDLSQARLALKRQDSSRDGPGAIKCESPWFEYHRLPVSGVSDLA